MSSRQVLQALDRPIAFQRSFVRLTGSINAALMLSQAIYWSLRSRGGDGWFWKTAEDWENETGMTRREQESARKLLRDRGLLEEEKRGMPAKIWFRVDEDNLASSLAENANQAWRKAPTKDNEKRQPSIGTESTSETTEQNKTPQPPLQASGALRVMQACGWVNRRLEPLIAEAMVQAQARGNGETECETASRMIASWQALQGYHADGLLMRPMTPRRFIAEAHWRTDAMWPWDHDRLREASRARVGAR